MTRKDYRIIAAALRHVKPSNPLTTPKEHAKALEYMGKEWSWTVDSIATALEQDNPRFNRVRFNEACNG